MWAPNVNFASPGFLWGLLLIPLLVYWYIRRSHEQTADHDQLSTMERRIFQQRYLKWAAIAGTQRRGD